MRETPDDNKRRITSILAQIAQQEAEFLHALDVGKEAVGPCVMDVGVLNPDHVVVYYTIEPFTRESEIGVQGWDVRFRRFRTFRWSEIVDGSMGTQTYYPATDAEWERRMRETNLLWVEENAVRQTKGKYR